MAVSQDALYLSLLGLAEHFRISSPPEIKHCIQCLQAVFIFKPPQKVEARTHLQLGNLLLTYTKNTDLAKNHLEQAWCLSQVINSFDDVKFEAASALAELYQEQHQSNLSKPILRKAIELSQHSIHWHCRLIFQLAQIHASEKEYELATSLLGVGVDFAHISSANYTKVLFLLSKCMLLLIDRKLPEASPILTQAGYLVDNWQGSQQQKEYLKVYFLVLQVCQYLMAGQVKTVKPCLKQLQQCILTIMQPPWPAEEPICGNNPSEMFMWMPKEYLYVVVYLVTVMHSVQAGHMDKAQKYIDKALTQIEKVKVVDNKPILSIFQFILFEHIIMCRLVMGNKSLALQEMTHVISLCEQHPHLLENHATHLHTLIGLYAMSMNCMEASEKQFTAALKLTDERELKTFINLNLGIIYIREKKDKELASIVERITPEALPPQLHTLRAAAYYVQGFNSFFQGRSNEAKRYLRETLKMANSEDLNRLTSCALVLLGHIFLTLSNHRESMNMVTPAMQLASKMPDVHVQLWATAILKDLYRICNDHKRENEVLQMHSGFSQMLLKDHYKASEMPEHSLINWTEGPLPTIESKATSEESVENKK